MAHQRLLSPPASNSGEVSSTEMYSSNRRHARTPSAQAMGDYSNGFQYGARSTAVLTPPAQVYPGESYSYTDVPEPYEYQYKESEDAGLGIAYNAYGQKSGRQGRNIADAIIGIGPFDEAPASPVTPSRSTPRNEPRPTRTRGLAASKAARNLESFAQVQAKTKAKRSPSKKSKKAQANADNGDEPDVTPEAPLSELAKQYPNVEVTDIEAFVNRSVEERHREVAASKDGKTIKRPSNAFILYRMAYQHTAKLWGKNNNHQKLSQICGAGWKREPEAVKTLFGGWAQVERDNHDLAHPGYKFSPSKNGAVKTSKRKAAADSNDDGEESDLAPYDPDMTQRGPAKRGRNAIGSSTRANQPSAILSRNSPYPNSMITPESSHDYYQNGGYQSGISRQPTPSSLHKFTLKNTGHPAGDVEDVFYSHASTSAVLHPGFSRSQSYPSMGPSHAQYQGPSSQPEQIDPTLMGTNGIYDEGFDGPHPGMYMNNSFDTDACWGPGYGADAEADYNRLGALGMPSNLMGLDHSQLDILRGGNGDWNIEPCSDQGFLKYEV